ncbi:MAG: zf-HC2 domain-containing protein [Candidatus Eremiobacteraeota bacterium]|nr:zf-HC2 domain-containing protein [Candidatus Eremiobacteraeota bacterium]
MRHECETLFETMSDWMDGHASALDSKRVEAHLQECSQCRQLVGSLRELPAVIPVARALPSDFASRVARQAEERVVPALVVNRAVGRFSRWLDSLVSLSGSHPLAALLETRALRAGLRGPSFWLATVVLAYGLPGLAMSFMGQGVSARFFVATVGISLLIALPLYHFGTDVSILRSLVRGRCLDEVLTSGLSSGGVSDALASFSLRSLMRVGLPVAFVLALGVGIFPASSRALALTAALGWLPLTACLLFVGSYLVQAVMVAPRFGSGAAWAAGLVAGGLGAGVAGGSGWLLWHGHGLACLAFSLVFGGLALLAGRSFTIAALERTVEPPARSYERNPWVGAVSDNPIVQREVARLAGNIPGGLTGLFLVRLVLPVLAMISATLLLNFVAIDDWRGSIETFLIVVASISFVRCAVRTSSALVEERERGTLETLLASGLNEWVFLRGWLQVACVPVYLELASVLAVAALGLAFDPMGWHWADWEVGSGLLTLIALLVMPLAGGLTGLAVSAQARSRSEAGSRALALVARTAWIWLMSWAGACLGLGVLATLLGGELSGSVWSSIMSQTLVIGTLGLTCLSAAVSSRRTLETSLSEYWEHQSPPTRRRLTGQRVMLVPATALTLVAALQAGGLVGMLTVQTFSTSGTTAVAAALATVMLVWKLATTCFGPLVRGLAEHGGQSLAKGMALGASLGAITGVMLSTVPLAAMALFQANLVAPGPSAQLAVMAWFAAFGLALGAAFGGGGYALSEGAQMSSLRPTLGRAALGLGLVILAWGGLRSLLLDLPEARTEEAAKIYEQARQRERARMAVSPRANGFEQLAVTFVKNEAPGARATAWGEDLKALSWAVMGEREDILKALAQEPERGLRDAQRFDRAMVGIKAAMRKPEWVVPPRWSDGIGAMVPNFILMRAVSQNLGVRALQCERAGDYAAALDFCLVNLDWADQDAGQGPLIHGMITVALEAIAGDSLLDLLAHHRFEQADYERILAAVDNQKWNQQAYVQHLDDELAFGMRVFQELNGGDIDMSGTELALVAPLALPSVYKERELRIYSAGFLAWRDAALGGRAPGVQTLRPGSLASFLLPNLTRANMQARLSYARLEAIRTVARLELYHIEHGEYPADLSQVAAGPDAVTPGGQFLYSRQGDSFVLKSQGPDIRGIRHTGDTEVWF